MVSADGNSLFVAERGRIRRIDLSDDDFNLDLLGFDEQELESILKDSPGLLEKKEAKPIVVSSHERKAATGSNIKPVTVVGDEFTLGGLKVICVDSDSVADVDWLIRRWQTKSGEDAIHKEGMTFNKLSDARKK